MLDQLLNQAPPTLGARWIQAKSRDFWDSIAVLLAPDGSPVVGSDDDNAYFAAFDWVAQETGTYMLHVTSFEAVSTGELIVTRAYGYGAALAHPDAARDADPLASWAQSSGSAWARPVALDCRALLTVDPHQTERLFRTALDLHRRPVR